MDFRVLGPLEASIAGVNLTIGGAKQRAVLAVLLLHADETVSVERLIDEVWGSTPPPSAQHSLESYVSRVRQLLNGHGPALVRRGAGYSLELGDATLDAQQFEHLETEVHLALGLRDSERAARLASQALALWRGPALPDVSLATAGRAAAERLEELRLRTLEQRFDAELALGRHRELIGELQSLVSQNPYRERFVEQLMLALYRSGRQAEALEVYERTRVALAEDLGLRPSQELQQLSAQIVRQEPQLRSVRRDPGPVARPGTIGRRARKVSELVAVGALAAATMALTASGSAPSSPGAKATSSTPAESGARVALVVPKESRYPQLVPWDGTRFRAVARGWGFETEVVIGSGARLRNRIQTGGYDLVLVSGRAPTAALSPVARALAPTKLVFLDASLVDLSLQGAANVSAVRFADEEVSELAGYLSALVPRRGRPSSDRVDMVSVVAGPDSAHARRVVAGFRRGVERVRARHVALRVDYVDVSSLATCERVANDQIDAGADVVFADAGSCGLGALAVARLRGVWGIGWYEDGVDLGPHILAVQYKDYEHAIRNTFAAFARGKLVAGEDAVLGLNHNYAVGIEDKDRNAAVPDWIWSKVVDLCSSIRQHTRSDAP
jgi:DNA-binding SARP family transcriptional activator/basic membrane lipoprotein Med (substrate-binding protein (PBP1-ABC) superfamily)